MCSCLHPGLSPPPHDFIPTASHPPAPNAHQLWSPRLAPGLRPRDKPLACPQSAPLPAAPPPAAATGGPQGWRSQVQLLGGVSGGGQHSRAPGTWDENLRALRAPGHVSREPPAVSDCSLSGEMPAEPGTGGAGGLLSRTCPSSFPRGPSSASAAP